MATSEASWVEFRNVHGEALRGQWHGSPAAVGAIFCHDLCGDCRSPMACSFVQGAITQGINVLCFDFAGCGQSAGTFARTTLTRRMQDVDAAINFAQAQGVRGIVLCGEGLGGSVAYLAAARDERVVGVASVSACGRPAGLVGQRQGPFAGLQAGCTFDSPQGRLDASFAADVLAHNVVAAASVLRAPIMVIHGENDGVVPSCEAHDIATAARDARLELVPGADHKFSQAGHLRAASRNLVAFAVYAADKARSTSTLNGYL